MLPNMSKKLSLKESGGARMKKGFPETITHKISEASRDFK